MNNQLNVTAGQTANTRTAWFNLDGDLIKTTIVLMVDAWDLEECTSDTTGEEPTAQQWEIMNDMADLWCNQLGCSNNVRILSYVPAQDYGSYKQAGEITWSESGQIQSAEIYV